MSFQKGYHLMAKPMGPICNIDCEYCFYLEKKENFPALEQFLMSESVLEKYIKDYIEQDIPEIAFVWQGGEPMLAGIPFYKKVVELQRKYSNGRTVLNAIQTNGTLLDDTWCKFLKFHGFSVGLSFDGPKNIHDRYRKDKTGKGTFDQVLKAVRLLQKHKIEYNVLACVAKDTCQEPLKTYKFFKDIGVKFIQFTPIVERDADEDAKQLKLRHAMPGTEKNQSSMTKWSVEAEAYGDFLNAIFDEWVSKDVGSIYIMNFEWALTSWIGLPNTMCLYTKECNGCGIIEHNGDIYSCDHYMYPQFKLGNIIESHPQTLMNSEKQIEFGKMKTERLSDECKNCEVLFACQGECPRHRFIDQNGNDGANYLCKGYKKFFRHIHPYMKAMVQLIKHDQPVSDIMKLSKGPIVIVK